MITEIFCGLQANLGFASLLRNYWGGAKFSWGEEKGLKAQFFKKDRNIQISPQFRSGCTVDITVVLLYILA
jgi:hypothetical protein